VCVSASFSTVPLRSFRTSCGSNSVFDLVDGSFEPAGLLVRAHIVLRSLCAQEESVPRFVERWAHYIPLFKLLDNGSRQAQVADELVVLAERTSPPKDWPHSRFSQDMTSYIVVTMGFIAV
jgi:hypothetical protein